ncbi:MAG: macro domain-containing protein [Myxococcota bacterium]
MDTYTIPRSGVVVSLHLGDITTAATEAIVTAANSELAGGGGVDAAVHKAAGPELLISLRMFGSCPTGSAVVTPSFGLKEGGTEFVIHAVGPVWNGGGYGEEEQLQSAYESALDVAVENGMRSIAFPSISTGVYGYPVELAADVAVRAVLLRGRSETCSLRAISFYLFDDQTFSEFERALNEHR